MFRCRLLFRLCVAVGLAIASSFGAGYAQSPTLTVPDTSGTVATTLSLPVYLRGVPSLRSFEFKLMYNGDRIRFTTFSTPLAEFAGPASTR